MRLDIITLRDISHTWMWNEDCLVVISRSENWERKGYWGVKRNKLSQLHIYIGTHTHCLYRCKDIHTYTQNNQIHIMFKKLRERWSKIFCMGWTCTKYTVNIYASNTMQPPCIILVLLLFAKLKQNKIIKIFKYVQIYINIL
jgi:hypothetical protein